MAITYEECLDEVRALLPRGPMWTNLGSGVIGLLMVLAKEAQRVLVAADAALEEADPRTAVETLTDQESIYGLPHTGTTSERQDRLWARKIQVLSTTPADYLAKLTPVLGAYDLLEFTPTEATASGDERRVFNFYAFRDYTLPGSYDVAAAQAVIDKMRHSHTRGRVIETRNFRCDNPHSLCDRDLLGL